LWIKTLTHNSYTLKPMTHFTQKSLIVLLLVAVMAACGPREAREQEPVVSVSILPLQYFVDELTGQGLEVNVMVPQGASHGTYSPSPRQMQRLSNSGLYLRIGSLGYEQAFLNRLNEINPRMKVVDLNDGVQLIRGIIDHGDHVHEGGIDPHIWMSPKVMLSQLPVIRDALIEVYPELEETVTGNYDELYVMVESVHLEMEAVSEILSRRSFMIFHPALTYLARDYGLEQVSIEHEGKEPSPAQLSRLIRQAREQNIEVIFIQEEYDQRSAELVAAETGATVVQINPLLYDWPMGMTHLMETFKQYLR
jgi:zinc transport system substrate-binding protein